MKETIADIRSRRSCRKYTAQQVDSAALETVLEAATYTPTGHGKQSPRMAVVQNSELLAELSRLNAQIMDAKHDPLYGAPTAVVVFADTECPTGRQDAALLMGTLMLAAHAVGLASCWINRAKEMFMLPEGAALKAQWGIEDRYEGMAICILGYEAEGGTVPAKPRKADYIVRV